MWHWHKLITSLGLFKWQWMEWFIKLAWFDWWFWFNQTTQCDLLAGEKKGEDGTTTESQMKVRERAKGRCSLCQSWQIGQFPVCCDEEGRRGRRGQLKDPWQAGKRRGSLLKVVGRSALVAGMSHWTLFWRGMLSYLREKKDTDKILVSVKINRTNKLNCRKTDQAWTRIL